MKQARNAEEINQVREEILERALEIIVKKGYDALTMRHLASRVGMTAPNIYNYYSGKEALYFSLVTRGFEKLYCKVEKAYQSSNNKFNRVRAIFEAYIDFGVTNPRYYDIMFNRFSPYYVENIIEPPKQLPDNLPEAEKRSSIHIINMMRKGIEEMLGSDIDDFTVQMRIIQIWSTLHGMVTLHNSRVVSYVSKDTKGIYSGIIEEFIHMWKIL